MKITTREKRFLAAGALVCVLTMGWYYSDTLFPSQEDLSATVEYKKRMLLRQKETLNQEELYSARVDKYQSRLEQNMEVLLPGENASIAGAALQRVLSDLAEQSGVEITRKNIQKEQKLENDIVKVSVEIQVNCEPEQLVQLLAAVKNYEKLLTVDELTISGFRIQRQYQIRPNIKVSGYIFAPEADEEGKPAGGRS